MLSGKYKHTIDAKGRVIVPIRFREDLGDTFVVTRGLDECLALYSMQEWSGLEEKIKQLPMARSRQIQRYLFSNAFPVELDGQGRIVLPADLREFARPEKRGDHRRRIHPRRDLGQREVGGERDAEFDR